MEENQFRWVSLKLLRKRITVQNLSLFEHNQLFIINNQMLCQYTKNQQLFSQMEQLPSSLRKKYSPSLQASLDSITNFQRELPHNYLLSQNQNQKYKKLLQSTHKSLSQLNSDSENILLEDLIEFRSGLLTEFECLQKYQLIEDYIKEVEGLVSNNEKRVTHLEEVKEQFKLKNDEVRRITFTIQDLQARRVACINMLNQKQNELYQLDQERSRIRAESPLFLKEMASSEHQRSRNSSLEESKLLFEPEMSLNIKKDVSLSFLIQYNRGTYIFEERYQFKQLITKFKHQINPSQLYLCTFNDGVHETINEVDQVLSCFAQFKDTKMCFNFLPKNNRSLAKYDTSLKQFVEGYPEVKQFRQQILVIITCMNGQGFTEKDLKKNIESLSKNSPQLQVYFLDFGSNSGQILRDYSNIANPKNQLASECPSLTYFDTTSSMGEADDYLSKVAKFICDKNQYERVPKSEFDRQLQIEMTQQQKNIVMCQARSEKNFQSNQKKKIQISSKFLMDQNRSLYEDQLKRIENQISLVQEKISSCLKEEKDLNFRISMEELNASKGNMLISSTEKQISELNNVMNEGEVLQLIEHVENMKEFLKSIELYQKKVERQLNGVKRLQEIYGKGNTQMIKEQILLLLKEL